MTSDASHQTGYDAEYVLRILEVAERASNIRNLDELDNKLLPYIATAAGSSGVLVYVDDPYFRQARLFHYNCPEKAISPLEKLCASQLDGVSDKASLEAIPVIVKPEIDNIPTLLIYPLSLSGSSRGLIIFISPGDNSLKPQQLGYKLINIVSSAVSDCIEIVRYQRQISFLNVYVNVSTLLSQTIGLHQLLETILYCCMDATAAEAASVLLLNDEKKNFTFYQVEGPQKSILEKATFPADTGIAGAVLQNQQSEIINDVYNDARFNRDMDKRSGFQTRNMIALPLTAGEERIGVLEIVNKTGVDTFSEAERLVLVSIADEISFAIHNAKLFEYVANSYCKQRQGQNSCKGCQRPLGSWTPCVKYREIEV